MTEYKTHNNKDYVCVDKDAEPIDSDTSNKNGALFYPVRTTCGSLRCPHLCINKTFMLYIQHTSFLCDFCMVDISNCHMWFSLDKTELHSYLMCHCLLVQHLCPRKHNLYCYAFCIQS
jgi:hypothetical protein